MNKKIHKQPIILPMKRCSTLLINRETEIKTTMRLNLTPIRWTLLKHIHTHTDDITSAGKDVEKLELLYSVEGKYKMAQLLYQKITNRITL